jgi:hypothetical protein
VTYAVGAFLRIDLTRPLHARVAAENVASRRAPEKGGLRMIATERSFAEARSAEIEELAMRLDELPLWNRDTNVPIAHRVDESYGPSRSPAGVGAHVGWMGRDYSVTV